MLRLRRDLMWYSLPKKRRMSLLELQLWANLMSYSVDNDAVLDGLDDGYDMWLPHRCYLGGNGDSSDSD